MAGVQLQQSSSSSGEAIRWRGRPGGFLDGTLRLRDWTRRSGQDPWRELTFNWTLGEHAGLGRLSLDPGSRGGEKATGSVNVQPVNEGGLFGGDEASQDSALW